MERIEKIVNILKQQAELFLLDAGEFFPFGSCVDFENKIIPVAAYFENDRPSSADVIALLEKTFTGHQEKGDRPLCVLAIDISIKEDNKAYDAIEMRFFEPKKEVYKKYFKYKIKENRVEFAEMN
jgi:hypothetical protein